MRQRIKNSHPAQVIGSMTMLITTDNILDQDEGKSIVIGKGVILKAEILIIRAIQQYQPLSSIKRR